MIERSWSHPDWLTDDEEGKRFSQAIERCREFLKEADGNDWIGVVAVTKMLTSYVLMLEEAGKNIDPNDPRDAKYIDKIIKIEMGLYHEETPDRPFTVNIPELS